MDQCNLPLRAPLQRIWDFFCHFGGVGLREAFHWIPDEILTILVVSKPRFEDSGPNLTKSDQISPKSVPDQYQISLKVWPGSLKVWPGSLKVWPSSLKVWPSSLKVWPSRSYGVGYKYGVGAAKPRRCHGCWRHSSCWARLKGCWARL